MRDFIINVLEQARGDDYNRCKRGFAGLTDEAMNQEYGFSGFTHNELLERYKKRDQKFDSAIEWVKMLDNQ